MDKAIIRKTKLKERGELSLNTVKADSELICNTIIKMDLYKNANVILLYKSCNNEVDTDILFEDSINKGKIVAYPKSYVEGLIPIMDFKLVDDLSVLEKGYKGILEPSGKATSINPSDYEGILCIVPGVAFDCNHMRVGYGKGFYDRFLSEYPKINTIGLAYDCQIVDSIDKANNDMALDMIVTPTRII